MPARILTAVTLIVFASVAAAAPGPLEISNTGADSSKRYIRAVHKELRTATTDLHVTRLAILQGILETKGKVWTYEGEGDGYILARFHYRGDIWVMRVEYDENYVQLKYKAALRSYVCKKVVGSVCYKNAYGYFSYTKNLRASIAQTIGAS